MKNPLRLLLTLVVLSFGAFAYAGDAAKDKPADHKCTCGEKCKCTKDGKACTCKADKKKDEKKPQ
jgi:hypothetical protein